MTTTRQPAEAAGFTRWLAGLTARLRPDAGWYGVFAARDPEGLRACLDGTELLPWDVVSSLLRDAGEAADGPFAARGRALYVTAAGAHDRRPGAAEMLAERRESMERARRYADSRARALGERLGAVPGPGPEEAARLERDLARTRDDGARAAARVAELTARLAGVGEWGGGPVGAGLAPAGRASASPATPGPPAPEAPASPPPAPSAPGSSVEPGRAVKVGRRPRGARYAWLEEGDGAGEAAAVPVPLLPEAGPAPRGARFGGAGPDGPSGGGRGGPGGGPPAGAPPPARAPRPPPRARPPGARGAAPPP
ncbi:UL36 very large tegument protein, partial [Streptomyces sp. NPDC056528]